MEGSAAQRAEDVFRHLTDLRTRTYEGVADREGRVDLFRRGVELVDPVVRSVLAEIDAAFLERSGRIDHEPVAVDGEGNSVARWTLSWPEQRNARNVRAEGVVEPVQVVAWFAVGFNHPHLRGSRAGDWPFQVVDDRDARRQEPIVRAIIEAELHQRIFEGTWQIVPAAARSAEGPLAE